MSDAERRSQAAIRIARAEKIRLQRIHLKREQEERAFLRESNALKSQEETAQEKKLRFKAEGEKWIREKLKQVETIENEAMSKLKAEKKELLENGRNFLRENLERSKQAAERAARLEMEKKMRYDKDRAAREEKEKIIYVENQRLVKIENERLRAEKLRADSVEDAKRKARSLVLKARAEEAEKIRMKVFEAKFEEEERIYQRQLSESLRNETPIERKSRFKVEGEKWIRDKIGQGQAQVQRPRAEKVTPLKSEMTRKPSICSELSGYRSAEKTKTEGAKIVLKDRERKIKYDQERLIREEHEKKVFNARQIQWKMDNDKYAAERLLATAKEEAARRARPKEVKVAAEEAARVKLLFIQAKFDEQDKAMRKKSMDQQAEEETAQEKKKRFKAEGEKWIREKIQLRLSEEKEAETKAKLERKLFLETERKNLIEAEAKLRQEVDRMAREENEKRIRLNNERLAREANEKEALKVKQKQIKMDNVRVVSERVKLDEVIRRCRSLEIKGRTDDVRGYLGSSSQGSQDGLFGTRERKSTIESGRESLGSLARYKGKVLSFYAVFWTIFNHFPVNFTNKCCHLFTFYARTCSYHLNLNQSRYSTHSS
jgi:hypothetical protein